MLRSFVTSNVPAPTVTNEGWIQTFTGRKFFPLDPDPADIVIEDIAHALALQSRFSGHCREFYSVAQHSLLVSSLCRPEHALWGLLHDASEAYLVDIPSPIKHSGRLGDYREAEERLMGAVATRFGLQLPMPPDVKQADNIALATEAKALLGELLPGWGGPLFELCDRDDVGIVPMTWRQAEHAFLERFRQLAL